jgi:hypothetical protein
VVAAPIFKEIAAQSLRVLGYFPQKEPRKDQTPVLAGMWPSLSPTAAPPAPVAWEAPKAEPPGAPLKVMPDLKGRTIRQVLDLLHRAGLHCRFEGSGLAVSQEPSPGTPISPGTACLIKFQSSS